MLYTKNQPKTFFVLEEKTLKCFLPYMGMTAILFNSKKTKQKKKKTFEQIVSTTSTEGPVWNLVKTGKWFQRRRHLTIYEIFTCTKPWGNGRYCILQGIKFWLKISSFTTFTSCIIHWNFQPLVFNTFLGNDFSTFCMGTQIWPCHKKVKGHARIICINMVDL